MATKKTAKKPSKKTDALRAVREAKASKPPAKKAVAKKGEKKAPPRKKAARGKEGGDS